MKLHCYFNGKIVNSKKVGIPFNDLSILRGFGVLDFVRTYNGKPFHLKDHYQRFVNSARIMNLPVPLSEVQLNKALLNLLKKNRLKDATFRFILTGGPTADYITPTAKPNFYIIVDDIIDFPLPIFTKGAKLITAEYERPQAGAKNTNYLTAISLQAERIKKGAIEILFIKNGTVLEASTSNIFIVKDNELITPANRVLSGVTRKIVIQLAKKLKIKTSLREVTAAELFAADECFICATNKRLTPIVKINNQTIGKGKPGAITQKLLATFNDYVANY